MQLSATPCGHAEELVVEAMGSFKRRNLFIVSEVVLYNLACEGIMNSIQKSLGRVRTQYLDLYLIRTLTSHIYRLESR